MRILLKRRIILYIFVLAFLMVSFSFIDVTYSSSDKIDALECTYSDEYLEWLELSDEEKENTIMPAMCEVTTSDSSKSFSYSLKSSSLPTSYSSVSEGYTTGVKNQYSTGGCWTFSSSTVLETYLQKRESLTYTFSTRHMEYTSVREFTDGTNEKGYNRTIGSGGNYFMSGNYYVNNYGPVLESDMPFEDNEDTISLSEIEDKETVVDVNDVVLYTGSGVCSSSEIEAIKEYIYEYGSVASAMYMTTSSTYYNSSTYAYYYNGNKTANHAITLVGWDDDYDKSNFNIKPSNSGAFIVQNSYGSSWGDSGYFYISYEDPYLCSLYMAITSVDTDVEDNSYINDVLGYNAILALSDSSGSLASKVYAMSIFEKDSGKIEELKEITFATPDSGNYKIYYYAGDASSVSVSDMTLIGSGVMSYSGYMTYSLDSSISIGATTSEFSIVVYYNVSGSDYILPVSMSDSSFYSEISLDDNLNYISANGSSWQNLQSLSDADITILSIKAYTDDVSYTLTSSTYTIDDDSLYIYVNPSTSYSSFMSNVTSTSNTVYNGSSVVSSGVVKTGMTIDGYTIIVKGDVNGDGYVKMNDVMIISKYIVNGGNLDAIYKKAADVTGDSSIKMNDVMKISKYIVNGGSL